MMRTSSRVVRGAITTMASLMVACLLTSPADLPALPSYPPTIVRASASPPADKPLASFPRRLSVPVRLLDPTQRFEWRLYYNFESVPTIADRDGTRGLVNFDTVLPDGSNVRELSIDLTPPSDLARCHFIELRVAYAFGGTDFNTPAAPGGDSITWTYSPGGDLRGCPTFDAGAPLPLADGGDGGPQ
jgi:hypothetical protein